MSVLPVLPIVRKLLVEGPLASKYNKHQVLWPQRRRQETLSLPADIIGSRTAFITARLVVKAGSPTAKNEEVNFERRPRSLRAQNCTPVYSPTLKDAYLLIVWAPWARTSKRPLRASEFLPEVAKRHIDIGSVRSEDTQELVAEVLPKPPHLAAIALASLGSPVGFLMQAFISCELIREILRQATFRSRFR